MLLLWLMLRFNQTQKSQCPNSYYLYIRTTLDKMLFQNFHSNLHMSYLFKPMLKNSRRANLGGGYREAEIPWLPRCKTFRFWNLLVTEKKGSFVFANHQIQDYRDKVASFGFLLCCSLRVYNVTQTWRHLWNSEANPKQTFIQKMLLCRMLIKRI